MADGIKQCPHILVPDTPLALAVTPSTYLENVIKHNLYNTRFYDPESLRWL